MSAIQQILVGIRGGIPPVNTVIPSISGTLTVGGTLSVSNGTWTGTEPITFTRQWQRGTTNISGATSNNYTIQGSDEGNTLRARITGTNVLGSASAFSNSTNTVPCRANGTFVTSYCSGCTLYYTYANGSCGFYDVLIESNSQSCGCCPANGTLLDLFCSGCDLYYVYADGSCGSYSVLVESNSSFCGCGGQNICQAQGTCSGTFIYSDCVTEYVVGTTGFGGWGCGGYYTDDSNFGAIAVQQGLISSGQATFVTICDAGCGSSFSGCTINGVTTNSYSGWCAVTCC